MYRFIELYQGEVNDSKVIFTVNTAIKAHSSLSGFGKETHKWTTIILFWIYIKVAKIKNKPSSLGNKMIK